MQKKIGLFFGSFNPIHIGHLALANYFLSFANLNEVWMMVSPQNPFKTKSSLLNFRQRFNLVYMALEDHPTIKASNFESKLPVPSYTSVTLAKLSEKYPNYEFNLIIGSDNLVGLKKWKNIEYLLDNFKFLVYPRETDNEQLEKIDSSLLEHSSIIFFEAPKIEISSSFIRKSLKEKKDVTFFMPKIVSDYITDMKLYQN
ncbi:MAG: nicotinate (nicotinamide) nucleotide adenylyltransferase [Bacteroidota bacterium]